MRRLCQCCQMASKWTKFVPFVSRGQKTLSIKMKIKPELLSSLANLFLFYCTGYLFIFSRILGSIYLGKIWHHWVSLVSHNVATSSMLCFRFSPWSLSGQAAICLRFLLNFPYFLSCLEGYYAVSLSHTHIYNMRVSRKECQKFWWGENFSLLFSTVLLLHLLLLVQKGEAGGEKKEVWKWREIDTIFSSTFWQIVMHEMCVRERERGTASFLFFFFWRSCEEE